MKNFHLKTILHSFAMLSASLILVACGGGVTGDAKNFVVVDDQTVINLNQIILTEANVDQTVCVVIYESKLNASVVVASEVVLGEKTLEKGEHENIVVSLNRESSNQESLFVELHEGSCASDSDVEETSDVVITQNTKSAVELVVIRSTTPYLEVIDTKIVGERLNVKKVVADKPSWIVVHLSSDGELGDVVGSEFVNAGHESNVSVLIKLFQKGSGVKVGDKIFVALYEDNAAVANDTFDEAVDVLIDETKSTEFIVEFVGEVAVFEISPLSNGYNWDGNDVAKNKIAFRNNGVVGDENITLTIGERYEINNLSRSKHPFALTDSSGKYLLSQGLGGTFKNDSEVRWTDVDGLMSFTLTPELASKLSGYICVYHNYMSGTIIIN